jgi:hypothetical protein
MSARGTSRRAPLVLLIAVLLAAAPLAPAPAVAADGDASAAAIAGIAETFARSAVDSGLAVGVAEPAPGRATWRRPR